MKILKYKILLYYIMWNIIINTIFIILVLLAFLAICLFGKSIMLLRYYSNNYNKIRNQETDEQYPRIGY